MFSITYECSKGKELSKSKSKKVGMSPSAYAKHRGLHLSTVKQYLNEGTLEGAWKFGSNNRKIIFQKAADKILDNPGDIEDSSEENETQSTNKSKNGVNLVNARTAKTTIEAQISRIKYEKLKGSLVEKEDVVRTAKTMANLTKQSMLSLPDRLSPILAGESEVTEIYRILTEEINEAMRNLSMKNFKFFQKDSE
jgi:hypothetical protein